MFRKHESEVLVTGAGPVGLFTALRLAERGIKVRVIDQERRTASHSYALVLHPGTLEILAEAGLGDRLLEVGNRLDTMSLYDADGERAAIRFAELGGDFAHALVLPQSALETALEAALERKGVEVLWNHRLVGMEIESDGVTAEVAKLDRTASGYPYARMEWVVSKTFRSRTSFLIGADGYSSFVRKRAGVDYQDHGGALSFSVYEFECDADVQHDARLVLNPDNSNVLWPIGGGRFRFNFQVDNVSRHRGEPAQLEELIRERAPWFTWTPGEVRWNTSVLFERRLVDRFGSGRTWLAGDSAHITGPVGGQSMNVGMREGRDLAERMAACLRDGAPVESLEEYGSERVAEWRGLLGLDAALRPDNGTDPWIAERAERLLPCIPASGKALESLAGQLGLSFT
jgi:2-polyprenyl-6-methoxyphenol hydroxylase-like FAD-dependent oxidoreductase